ncbi:MAG: U32 family peptidase [Spirochaetales bacterium]|nr:U32 family peptidase [Spirochaetales bacterium]
MELLAPAGNWEKLKTAYLYGADAAYIGIKNFSLRAKADNFYEDDHQIVKRIKGPDKKLYCALNIYFHDEDIDRLLMELDYIQDYPIDAFIISDIGIVKLLQKRFPLKELHLSTQANCINSDAAMAYADLGFSRIILGREMSLKQIERVKKRTGLEIEVFVHGAMCLAYAGRCFLSKYMADRSANQGDCAHSCRWKFRVLEEEERPGQFFPVIQGEGFTSILSSKDMMMIDYLKELSDAGVDSLKIEGRMKSVYYTAIVTRAYRKALDAFYGIEVPDLQAYKDEIDKVSHREFSTGFFFDKKDMDKTTQKSYLREYEFLGTIGEELEPGRFKLHVKNQIRTTDKLEYIGYDVLFLCDDVFAIFNEKGEPVTQADHMKDYIIETSQPVKEGYLIRKKKTAY